LPTPANAGNVPDATPRAEPRSAHGNPPFYEVNGRRYQVLASAEGHVERGVASWYGPDFHGHNTSSGEPYDMYAMTAAHKTLPLPCYARITNLSNGRSIVVRINDRGPFVANRIVDLSYSAALKLDIVRTGTALVELQTVGPVTDGGTPVAVQPRAAVLPPAAPAATPVLYIQVGAYGDAGNAQRVLLRLKDAGIATAFILAGSGGGQRLARVRIGPIGSVEQFDTLAARLAALGFPDARLASD
jgi:rare lipoprotein A